MPIFVVVAIRKSGEFEQGLSNAIAENNLFQVKDDVWLIDFEGTTRQLSERLGFNATPGSNTTPSGIVFPITNYFGLASPDIWEWLGTHISRREG